MRQKERLVYGNNITHIPSGLRPHFQEYDLSSLELDRDADLIIQRTLEYGTWDEIRWLVASYGVDRVRTFVRVRGERMLSRVTFNDWRKLIGTRRWRHSPFPKETREVQSVMLC